MMNILIGENIHQPGYDALMKRKDVQVDRTRSLDDFYEVPKELLRGKEILFGSCPPKNFSDMDAVKFIQIGSAGYSQLYGLDLVKKGVRCCNGLGNFDVPIAEWNIAMMINARRDLRQMIRNQEKGVWDRSARFQSEIRGSVVGLWGYGGIGRETARLAKAMGLKVHVLSRSGVKSRSASKYCVPGTGDPEGKLPDRVFGPDQTGEFLKGLDFLVLSMPQTKTTEGIVGERELRALPKHAHVLNPARGPLIQEAALLKALKEGWIAGAALDTHYRYPMPPDHPLWSFPNVIMTPHISGSGESPYYLERIWDIFLQNLDRYATGKPLLNELTADQLNGN